MTPAGSRGQAVRSMARSSASRGDRNLRRRFSGPVSSCAGCAGGAAAGPHGPAPAQAEEPQCLDKQPVIAAHKPRRQPHAATGETAERGGRPECRRARAWPAPNRRTASAKRRHAGARRIPCGRRGSGFPRSSRFSAQSSDCLRSTPLAEIRPAGICNIDPWNPRNFARRGKIRHKDAPERLGGKRF